MSAIRIYLLAVIIVVEVKILIAFFIKYLEGKRKGHLSKYEAFFSALSSFQSFQVPEGLKKYINIELNIYRSLFLQIDLIKFGQEWHEKGRLLFGYTSKQLAMTLMVLTTISPLFIWLLHGYFKLIPVFIFTYLFLLINCEYISFSKVSITLSNEKIHIPNGIYGTVSLDTENIARISRYSSGKGRTDMEVRRLNRPDILIELKRPMNYFGKVITRIRVAANLTYMHGLINRNSSALLLSRSKNSKVKVESGW